MPTILDIDAGYKSEDDEDYVPGMSEFFVLLLLREMSAAAPCAQSTQPNRRYERIHTHTSSGIIPTTFI
jgi:hypothetical protein